MGDDDLYDKTNSKFEYNIKALFKENELENEE